MIAALVLLATGVLLPTVDVFSDIYLAVWLFQGSYFHEEFWLNGTLVNCKEQQRAVLPHPKFGAAVLAPIFLSWIFIAHKWYVTEKNLKQKLITLPFLLLQVYPQWKAVQVLYHAWVKKGGKSVRMKDEWETGISYIG